MNGGPDVVQIWRDCLYQGSPNVQLLGHHHSALHLGEPEQVNYRNMNILYVTLKNVHNRRKIFADGELLAVFLSPGLSGRTMQQLLLPARESRCVVGGKGRSGVCGSNYAQSNQLMIVCCSL